MELTVRFYVSRAHPRSPMACLTVLSALAGVAFLCRAAVMSGVALVSWDATEEAAAADQSNGESMMVADSRPMMKS